MLTSPGSEEPIVWAASSTSTGWSPELGGRGSRHPQAYDTTELLTRVDEVLDVVAEDLLSGWIWCVSRSDRGGRPDESPPGPSKTRPTTPEPEAHRTRL